uniref:Leucine rich immune protein (Coil-less) n=1 Tax=Anopheles culicifacies TaxID=139723 RepID=A0A182MJ76_9DIPT
MSCTVTAWAPHEEGTFVLAHVPAETMELKFINLKQHSFDLGMLREVVRHGITIQIEKSPIQRVVVPVSVNVTYVKIHRTYLKDMAIASVNVNMEALRISESRLKSVPPTVVHLPAVRHIEIINSPIEAVNLNLFAKLQHLQQLNLSGNKIRFLHITGNGGDRFSSLREIFLSNNLLTTVSLHSFSGMKALETLDLQKNRISRVQGLLVSDSLKTLDLSWNRLTTLYCCEWNLSNLTLFSANDNALTWLPTCLVQAMPNIDYLGLKSNALVDGNVWNVFTMEKLKRVDFSFNKLTSAVYSSVTPSLDILNLSNNRITRLSIPQAGRGLKIIASNNFIETFDPKSLSPNVTLLEMFCNPIDCSFNKALMRKGEEIQCIKRDQKL